MYKTKTVKILKQTGSMPNIIKDMEVKARLPGKRISKTGKVYWETRRNRSDALGHLNRNIYILL